LDYKMNRKNEMFENILLAPCSGAEYHGELARQVAIKLSEKSVISTQASMFCSTIFFKNILFENERLLENTKNRLQSSYLIIIEGCKTSCESLIFKNIGIQPDMIIHVEQIVPKEKINFNDIEAFKNRSKLSQIKEDDINNVAKHILDKLKSEGMKIRENEY